jgi:hypothetical protein
MLHAPSRIGIHDSISGMFNAVSIRPLDHAVTVVGSVDMILYSQNYYFVQSPQNKRKVLNFVGEPATYSGLLLLSSPNSSQSVPGEVTAKLCSLYCLLTGYGLDIGFADRLRIVLQTLSLFPHFTVHCDTR